MQLRATLISVLALTSGCASIDRPAPQFQVGDVVVARNFSNHPHLNGTQVRVTGDYQWRWIRGGNTLRCYAVTTVDGEELAAQGYQLQQVAKN